jgi:hypothetical protein
MDYQVEYTDMFGGEANYSWVKRATVEYSGKPGELPLVRVAKAAIGLTGVRCRREEWGEAIVLRPCGSCTIAFITPIY